MNEVFYHEVRHEIYNGDALVVMPTLETESVNLIVSAPPYEDFSDLPWLQEMRRILHPDGVLLHFWASGDLLNCLQQISQFFNVTEVLSWPRNRTFTWTPIVCAGSPSTRQKWTLLPGFRLRERRFNSAQLPIELIEQLVGTWSKAGDLVVDPYLGSGTVCVAAKNLGRRSIGIEVNKKMCQVAMTRLQGVL